MEGVGGWGWGLKRRPGFRFKSRGGKWTKGKPLGVILDRGALRDAPAVSFS